MFRGSVFETEFTTEVLIELIKNNFGRIAEKGYPTITLEPKKYGDETHTLVTLSTQAKIKELELLQHQDRDGLQKYVLLVLDIPEIVEIKFLNGFSDFEAFSIANIVKLTVNKALRYA